MSAAPTEDPPTTVETISVAKVKAHPYNPRHDVGDVTDLAASIKAVGLLQPVTVAPAEKGSGYVLLYGHRRHAATKLAKLKSIDCIVRSELTTEAAQLEAMLVENLHRIDLTAVEEGEAYTQLAAFPGYDVKTIAARTGRTQKAIRDRMAVAGLPKNVRAGVHGGQITLDDAAALAAFSDAEQVEYRLLENVGTSNWRYTLQRAVEDRALVRTFEKELRALTKAGVRLIDPYGADQQACGELWWELDDLLEPVYEGRSQEAERNLTEGEHVDEDALYAKVEVELSPEKHATCPGHAAAVSEGGRRIDYWCTQPVEHGMPEPTAADASIGTAPASSSTPGTADATSTTTGRKPDPAAAEATARREAERAAEEQLRADLSTAATVRREHLTGVAQKGDPDIAREVLRRVIAFRICGSYEADRRASTWLRFLGMDVSLARSEHIYDNKAAGERSSAVYEHLASWPLPRLAITVGMVHSLIDVDHQLEDPSGWRPRTALWREAVSDLYGYEWSDVEQRLVDAAAAAGVDGAS